jgi:predicted nucleic acid-binding protein
MAVMVTDSTPWIAFFKGEDCPILEAGLDASIIELPALVKVELLGNRLPAKERKNLEEALSRIPLVEVSSEHLSRAGKLKADLTAHGFELSARDAHILQSALDRQAILLTNDPLFHRMQDSSGVRTQMW